MSKLNKRDITAILLLVIAFLSGRAEYPVNYEVSLTGGSGSGDFAPYYIYALRGGRISSASDFQAEASLWCPYDRSRRFSYGFGADIISGSASSVDYERYDATDNAWYLHPMRPSSLWVQQLYGEVKYRSLFLTAGLREHSSALLNQRLTSGDLVESGNSRPIPQVRIGFIDFQDIPFTQGWVQIQGEISYGKKFDNGWWRDHYNYFNSFLSVNEWYTYKRCYFRSRPAEPFSVTAGMQVAGEFGGTTYKYRKGKCYEVQHNHVGLSTFFKMIVPINDGDEAYHVGNHLGSWDFRARYRLKSGHKLYAYFSWPFEDGTGIGKRNGWDGLWGLEYKAPSDGIIDGAVIEYMDYTNQSGPIHFNPDDFSGTTISDHVNGSDDYYNHASYNSYAYYGMSIGTPALMAPIYNLDGYNRYVGNALRGFHVAVEGKFSPEVGYRLKGGYRKAWGSGYLMLPAPIHLSSFMAEVTWRPSQVRGLTVNAQLGVDRGNMPEDAVGLMVSVKYNGFLKF